MDCPRKPLQSYCEKVEQEKCIEFPYGNKEFKINLEGVDYNKLKVVHTGVIFQKIVPDVDLYNSAMLKYEENYKLYKEWLKQQRPIEIAKLQSEIDKLKKELETFNVETSQAVS